MKTVLLLAGTAEARALATAFEGCDVRMIASLAGATARPLAYPCETRIGGFGGIAGLREYLVREKIDALVDATHPFASGISRNANLASAAERVPLLSFTRQPWPAQEHWHSFATFDDAARALPGGARVLATTGRKEVGPLLARADLMIFLRSVDPMEALPPHIVPIAARGPFSISDEVALMREARITHLLTRNSGGDSRARLDAAALLSIPAHVVERPPPSAANVVHSVAEALRWLREVVGD